MKPIILALALTALSALPAAALEATPRQTEGPYYPVKKPAESDNDLTRVGEGPQAAGQALLIKGVVLDTAGKPIKDARVEIWQTDAKGAYMHPRDPKTAGRDQTFQFYGVAATDAKGAFTFRTILPGTYEGRARHIHAKITPPGGATLTTQLYFKGDQRLATDGIAKSLGANLSRVTLDPKTVAGGGLEATVTLVAPRG